MTNRLPLFCAMSLLAILAVILFLRGGILFWVGAIAIAGVAIKIFVRPGSRDLAAVLSIGAIIGVASAGIYAYVLSTWESVETVTLEFPVAGQPHSVRTWIMDDGDAPWVFYDVDPAVESALSEPTIITVIREKTPEQFMATARVLDELPEKVQEQRYNEYLTKYGEFDFINTVFFAALGRKHERVLLILDLEAVQ